MGCLLAGASNAEDNWSILPSIKQDMYWQTNPLLLSTGHKTLYGSVTTPQLMVVDNTPTIKFDAKLSLNENIFNISGFDSTDLHSKIDFDKKLERWEAGFTEQSDYDTTRTSEITTFNNNTLGSIRHLGNSVSPMIAFTPTATDKLSLIGNFTKSQYYSAGFSDYHIYGVTPQYEYSYNQLNKISLSVQMQRYETDSGPDATVDSIGPMLGWTAILTPNWTAKVAAGAQTYRQQSSATTTANQDWKWQGIFTADLSHKSEQDTLDLSAVRALQPYANGTEYFLNTLSLSDAHDINKLFSTTVNASYQFADSNHQGNNLKALISAGAGLAYHATPNFDVTASYAFRDQELTNIPGNQNDHLVTVGLVFRPILSTLSEGK